MPRLILPKPPDGEMTQAPGATWSHANERFLAYRTSLRFLAKFWKMMFHIYGCKAYDLFTWGVRISEPEEDNIIRELCELLPHEAFRGNIVELRMILQVAVTLRVEDHVQPIGPLDTRGTNKLAEQGIPFGLDPADYDEDAKVKMVEAWNETHRRYWIASPLSRELHRSLERSAEKKEKKEDPSERWYWVVELRDVRAIKTCIDRLHAAGRYRMSVVDAHTSWVRANLSVWGNLQPCNLAQLRTLEKESMLARKNAVALDKPDYPSGQIDVPYWFGPRCDIYYRHTMSLYSEKWYKN